MSQAQHDPQALRARLLEKASNDDGFRARLLAEPKVTIEQELGLALGPDLEIQVVEETPSRICLVLPTRSSPAEGAALSDQELASVAGGVLPNPLPRQVFGYDRLNNLARGRLDPVALTPIQIP